MDISEPPSGASGEGLPDLSYRAPVSRGKRIWRIARWSLGIIVLLYVGLVIYRIPAVGEKERTKETVAFIHAQKVTLDDVWAKNLPTTYDPELIASTIEGVDENKNGIRDDVEKAILETHYDSARVRAAEMQYAVALQMELKQVFNSETLVAASQEESRGSYCVSDTQPKVSLSDSHDVIVKAFAIGEERQKEVESLVFNTEMRKQRQDEIFNKYMVSHGDIGGQNCDIDLVSLPN